MHHPTDRITHTTAFVTPVVEHWLEQEIAQWVHPMKDRSDDPSWSTNCGALAGTRVMLDGILFDILYKQETEFYSVPYTENFSSSRSVLRETGWKVSSLCPGCGTSMALYSTATSVVRSSFSCWSAMMRLYSCVSKSLTSGTASDKTTHRICY